MSFYLKRCDRFSYDLNMMKCTMDMHLVFKLNYNENSAHSAGYGLQCNASNPNTIIHKSYISL